MTPERRAEIESRRENLAEPLTMAEANKQIRDGMKRLLVSWGEFADVYCSDVSDLLAEIDALQAELTALREKSERTRQATAWPEGYSPDNTGS